jgi:tetratricopeptide (TPR) repeat protein
MRILETLLASTQWTPEFAGELTGGSLVLLLQVFGIVKCALIMRRPTTSKLCVSALLILLLGWFLSSLGFVVIKIFGLGASPIQALTGILAMILMLVGLVLGIVGLATYDRARFVQGRAQAIWAVVLGGLMVAIFLGAVVVGIVSTIRSQSGSMADASSPGAMISKEEFNFSVTPSARWIVTGPSTKSACLSLRRSHPEIFFWVIGERSGDILTLAKLKEASMANLVGASRVLKQSEETAILDGVTFTRVASQVRMDEGGLLIDYEHWLAVDRGFAWQFIFWCVHGQTGLATEARSVMDTFKVLDRTKQGSPGQEAQDVSRPAFGYHTKIKGSGWRTSNDAGRNALEDFCVTRSHEGMLVLPLRFNGEPPDLDAISRGLLSTMNFQDVAEEDLEVKPWDPGHGGTGRELLAHREVDGVHYRYILRVARGKDSAHLVAGWAGEPKGDFDLLRKSLDAITLETPSAPAPALNPEQKKALGLLLNQSGISLLNRNENEEAAKWFYKAFEQSKDATLLGNAGDALERAEKYVAGRDLLTPHMKDFPANHYLGLRYARLQALSGNARAGAAAFVQLIEQGLQDEDDLLSWLTLLTTQEAYPQALDSAEAWVARHPTANARRWQAQVFGASGDAKGAVALLEKLHTENPKDTKVSLDLGRYLNDADEHTKAADLAQELLADGKESPRALMILGWSQMGRKWYRDAKTTFERALKKQPDDENIQDAIRRASAMLGQGDNSSIRDPLKLVAIPPSVASGMAALATPPDFGSGHSSAWLMRATGWHFEKGKPLRKTLHRRVKILNSEGARDFSSIEISFDPLNERVFMNRLEVKSADGTLMAKADVADAYVRDLDDSTATSEKLLHLQVAGVQPGCVVEWEITVEDRANSEVFPFQRFLFASGLPVAAEAVFVTGDVSTIKAELAEGYDITTEHTDKLLAWIVPAQGPTPNEPLAIWRERRCPALCLGGDEGSWEKIAGDFLKQIEDRLKPEKSVVELSANLTVGCSTNEEKVAAIARHVQKEYGYKAIEFGVRARRPNDAASTVKLRYGDCKDFSLLLHQLLDAAGVESYLTLVNTGWRVRPGLPSLDQFNHMVVHVPALGNGWLLDATDKTLDLGRYSASYLWHAHALVLDPAKPRLLPPRATVPAGSCEVASSRSVTPAGSDWSVEEVLTLGGYFASSMRDAFSGLNADEQFQKVQRLLAAQGAAQLERFHFDNLEDPTPPATLHLTYKVHNAISGGGGTASVPALWERDYLQTVFVKNRRTAFENIYPMHLTSEVTVRLPSAPTADSVKALEQKGASEFCTWKLNCSPARESDKAGFKVRFDFTTKPGEYPAARYGGYHDAWEAARSSWDRQISWTAK